MPNHTITDEQLNYEIELISDRVEFALANLKESKRALDGKLQSGIMNLIAMSQVSEMCRQILQTVAKISNDAGSKDQSALLLTAIESLDEVRQLIKEKNFGTEMKDKIFKVATTAEILK